MQDEWPYDADNAPVSHEPSSPVATSQILIVEEYGYTELYGSGKKLIVFGRGAPHQEGHYSVQAAILSFGGHAPPALVHDFSPRDSRNKIDIIKLSYNTDAFGGIVQLLESGSQGYVHFYRYEGGGVVGGLTVNYHDPR